jgi:hypothetical protein
MPPSGYQKGGNGGGGWGRIILCVILAIVISCAFTYYWVGNLDAKYQTLPANVEQAIASLNSAIAGLPDTIASQLSSSLDSVKARLTSLENNESRYATSSQLNQKVDELQDQIDTLQTISGSGDVTIEDLLEQIDTIQDNIDSLQTLLNQVIALNDLLHNTISISVSGTAFGVVGDNSTGITSSKITLQIINGTSSNVTLDELIVKLILNMTIANPWSIPDTSHFTLTPWDLSVVTYTPILKAPITGGFRIEWDGLGILIPASGTANITLSYSSTYTNTSAYTIETIMSNFTISPTVTLEDYSLY